MSLTDTDVRKTKPKEKTYTLSDNTCVNKKMGAKSFVHLDKLGCQALINVAEDLSRCQFKTPCMVETDRLTITSVSGGVTVWKVKLEQMAANSTDVKEFLI